MRSSFGVPAIVLGPLFNAVCGFHFCVGSWKTPPWAWEKHQCCYKNGLWAPPLRPAELSRAKPISEVTVRPVILPSLPLDTGLCSGEGEAAASSMAHKTCLRRLPRQSLLGAGVSGSRSAGLCPRGRPCRSLRDPPPPCKRRLLGFSPPRLLTPPSSVSLIFFSSPKTRRIHLQVGSLFLFFLFNMDEGKILLIIIS